MTTLRPLNTDIDAEDFDEISRLLVEIDGFEMQRSVEVWTWML